jgi:hypothetical protein
MSKVGNLVTSYYDVRIHSHSPTGCEMVDNFLIKSDPTYKIIDKVEVIEDVQPKWNDVTIWEHFRNVMQNHIQLQIMFTEMSSDHAKTPKDKAMYKGKLLAYQEMMDELDKPIKALEPKAEAMESDGAENGKVL